MQLRGVADFRTRLRCRAPRIPSSMAVIAAALFAVSPYLIAKERMLATEAGSIYASWANGGDRLLSV